MSCATVVGERHKYNGKHYCKWYHKQAAPHVCFEPTHATVQSVSSGLCYIVAQCLGGILGAAGAFYSLPGML